MSQTLSTRPLCMCAPLSCSHTWQAQMDARNVSVMKRQLQGRRSAAALEWLLKRQQERQHVEQETHRVREPSSSDRSRRRHPTAVPGSGKGAAVDRHSTLTWKGS